MKQYPHFLFVKQVSESVQDANGNWSKPTENWVFHAICREQTNGKGSLVSGQDGKAIVFSSVVHLPLNTQRVIEGSEVLVSELNDYNGPVRIQKQVLKYDLGQLHSRLWV